MEKNPLNKGILPENAVGVGTVSRGMVRERAVELAVISGHSEQEVSKADWEQAKRELTGEAEIAPDLKFLELSSQSYLWDSRRDSNGHKVATAPSEDEDDEGRSESAQLYQEGVNEAEHDQMLQAARSQRPEDAP